MHESDVMIELDGCPRVVSAGSTLADLIDTLAQPPESIATAVDGVFVGRGQRATHMLRAGALVALFRPIAGG